MINLFQAFSVLHVTGAHLGQVFVEGYGESSPLPPECTPEFKNSKDHTMCKYFDDERVTKSGVSDADKKIIVDLHNHLRGEVKPPAMDLTKMVWDDDIAAVAQKWAKQCTFRHDKNRKIPAYGLTIGQNIAVGSPRWESAVMSWYSEVRKFKYGKNPEVYLGKNGWKKIGHFTQIVHRAAYRIGCGYAECSSTRYKRFYVCNYGQSQTRNVAHPYSKGKRCSACPTSCNNGLCDCNGKMCLNGGKLDINSCTCACRDNYKGPICETLTPPSVFVSKHNCTYQGQRPSEANCSIYGDNGADKRYCETLGGQFGCFHCTKFNNIKYDYCPVMCGLCDGPCDGKNCQNNGKLNRDTCQCECPDPFIGETCEEISVSCPRSDKFVCGKHAFPQHCHVDWVLTDCPYMCGICS